MNATNTDKSSSNSEGQRKSYWRILRSSMEIKEKTDSTFLGDQVEMESSSGDHEIQGKIMLRSRVKNKITKKTR